MYDGKNPDKANGSSRGLGVGCVMIGKWTKDCLLLVQGRILACVLEREVGRELGGRFGTLLDRRLMSVAAAIRERKGGRN